MEMFAMSARKMLVRVLAAALAWAAVPCVFVTSPARAQDTGALIKKLSGLAERKGYDDSPFRPGICEALGWPARFCGGGSRLCFQAPYDDNEWVHSITSCRDPGNQPLRIVFVIRDKRSGYVFWTDPDGTLRGCVRMRRVGPEVGQWDWIKISCQDEQVGNSFASEIAYWGKQQLVLEKEPDRKD
jgi:hypothetical protein